MSDGMSTWGTRGLAILTLVVLATGCKSSSTGDQEAKPVVDAQSTAVLDLGELSGRVQSVRDREFGAMPVIAAVQGKPAAVEVGCDDQCQADRGVLREVLFGGKNPRLHSMTAAWDREAQRIQFDESQKADVREADVATALVTALDAEHFGPVPAASSWDGLLARDALVLGPGTFVAAVLAGRQRRSTFDADTLATHPETLFGLLPHAVDDFGRREGLAAVAALHRSSGWSGVELLRQQAPKSTAWIVRPDRWIAGEDLGTWAWPPEVDQARQKDGWQDARSGRVGPGLTALWLSQHIPVAAARSVYLGWQSGAYRYRTRGDGWLWEWTTMWDTPFSAQQVMEAFEAAFRQQASGRYAVLRAGTTVVVVGSSEPLPPDALEVAGRLAASTPTFRPGAGAGLAFKPTPADALRSRAKEATLQEGVFDDPVTGVQVTLDAKNWEVQKADESRVRWFAKHPSGAMLQMLTEVPSPLDPAPDTPQFLELVEDRFQKTLTEPRDVAAAPVTVAGHEGVLLRATGRLNEGTAPARFSLWYFPIGAYTVSFSLQAPPDEAPSLEASVTDIIASATLPEDADEASGSIIKFEVEQD